MEKRKNLYLSRDAALRNKFNDVAKEYEKFRFAYPNSLYETIWQYVSDGKNALEIGIGTGKATEPFLEKGYHILAIEPCIKMMQIAEEKYKNYDIEFLNTTFEESNLNSTFDVVYAASAFQWLSNTDRVNHIYSLLNPNGAFIRFKTVNVINPSDSIQNEKLRNSYQRVIPEYLPDDKHVQHMKDDEYLELGFRNIRRGTYYQKHEYSIRDYLQLVNTYTEYLVLDAEIRSRFEQDILENFEMEETIILTQKCTLFMCEK